MRACNVARVLGHILSKGRDIIGSEQTCGRSREKENKSQSVREPWGCLLANHNIVGAPISIINVAAKEREREREREKDMPLVVQKM